MEVAPSLPPPPERFDLAAAKADRAASRPGPLSAGLHALAASRQALDQVAQGIAPERALKDWQGALPERATAAGPAP